MKKLLIFLAAISLLSCKSNSVVLKAPPQVNTEPLVIAFGSCNDQDRPQPLWEAIAENDPELFIWMGDNVYADTEDMDKMKADYTKVFNHPDYKTLRKTVPVIGTWDDHDYGKNDAGKEWPYKDEAKDILLDFLETPEAADVRKRDGVYYSHLVETDKGRVKIILLDTRYFRGPLKSSDKKGVRYEPWPYGEGGSILGEKQWEWLEEELKEDIADYTIIVSSIQFLADEHGWEKWRNHPHEVAKMYRLLNKANSKNIFFLSGDRHQAEFSVNEDAGLSYPLVDVTSSGLTHTFPGTPMDTNRYRVKDGTKEINFGILRIDFENATVTFETRGKDNKLIEDYTQKY